MAYILKLTNGDFHEFLGKSTNLVIDANDNIERLHVINALFIRIYQCKISHLE